MQVVVSQNRVLCMTSNPPAKNATGRRWKKLEMYGLCHMLGILLKEP